MAGLDWIVLGVVLVSCIVGAMRGVIKEVFSLGAWVAGVVAAWMFGEIVISALSAVIENPSVRVPVGYVVTFFAAFALVTLVAYLLRTALKKAGLSGLDRGLGSVFGVARAALVMIVFGVIGGLAKFSQQPWWSDALTAPPLETAVMLAKPFLPASVAARIAFDKPRTVSLARRLS